MPRSPGGAGTGSKASVSLSPTMTPTTSRPPSWVTPVAMTTAWGDDAVVDAGLDVGGVEEQVETGVVQRTGPEGVQLFVQVRVDPGHLTLRYPGVRAQGLDPVIDRPGGHAVDVGFHDDRVESLVDARRRSRRLGKKLPARVSGSRARGRRASGHRLLAVSVAPGGAGVGVFAPTRRRFVVASASISSCSSLSATSRTSSRPSAERSDSKRPGRSCWDKATVHPLGSNCPFTRTVARWPAS